MYGDYEFYVWNFVLVINIMELEKNICNRCEFFIYLKYSVNFFFYVFGRVNLYF